MFKDCELILSVEEAKNHEKWLEVRNKGLGGSDAGVIMGLNPYKSLYELWMEKTGQKEPEDLSNNRFVYWGQKHEPNVADWFVEETGKKVQRMGTVQNKEHPFMLANVDRVVIGENAGLEIKTADVKQYKNWKDDEIPDSYYCQCLHYMAVTGADYWYIAVLLGGNDPHWKKIERNEEDIKALIEAETAFWKLVEDRTPPAVDGTKSCSDALAERYGDSNGEEIALPEEADTLIMKINGDTEIIKSLEKEVTANQNKLKEMLGEAEVGRVGSYKVTWKTTPGRETLSLASLKKQLPKMYTDLKRSGVISTGKASRRFSIKEITE